MRLESKYVLSALTSLAIFAAGASAQAGPRGGHHRGEERFFDKITKEMNLTAEQQAKLKAIRGETKDSVKSKRNAMKAAHEALDDALKGAASDDEVRAKFAELQKAQEEFAKARFEKVLAVRAILTPEQRAKFKGMGPHHGFKHHGHKDGEAASE